MARTTAGLNSNAVSDAGGSVRVTIPGSPFQVQANGGVSIPCRKVYIVAPNGSSNIRVQLGQPCTATTGIQVPEVAAAGANTRHLPLNIADVNMLYFIGEAENDVVDILYLK